MYQPFLLLSVIYQNDSSNTYFYLVAINKPLCKS